MKAAEKEKVKKLPTGTPLAVREAGHYVLPFFQDMI